MTWLVRLGTDRGEGAYIYRPPTHIEPGLAGPEQRRARRFELRRLAKLYAVEWQGRVVRLRRKR